MDDRFRNALANRGRRWAALGFALLLIMAVTEPAYPQSPPAGFVSQPGDDRVHRLRLTDTDGHENAPAVASGRVTLVHAWATWCPPCLTEIPALDRMAAKGLVDVITVAEDDTGLAAAGPVLDRLNATHVRRWSDPHRRLTRSFAIRELPATLVLLPDGGLAGVIHGPVDWTRPETEAWLESLYRSGTR
jgi:thiol-disulfide isomerase/thioredoxin